MSTFESIPNFTELRANKAGYDTRYEIDKDHPLHNDPLVDPREPEFGFTDASSYYSKPNRMTGELLPGIPDAPLLRLDIAKRLVQAEKFLRSDPYVRATFAAPMHLRIDDAYRPFEAQKFAFEVAWPMVIKSAHPEMTDKEIAAEVPNYCAKPADKPTPTPHATGGSVDVALINLETNEPVDRGHKGGKVKGTAYPDFHEAYHLTDGQSDIENSEGQAEVAPPNREVVLGRRVLYHAMTKVAGLYVNPQEIWHYGKGDPLSAYVSGSEHPYYGIATPPGWYQAEMDKIRS